MPKDTHHVHRKYFDAIFDKPVTVRSALQYVGCSLSTGRLRATISRLQLEAILAMHVLLTDHQPRDRRWEDQSISQRQILLHGWAAVFCLWFAVAVCRHLHLSFDCLQNGAEAFAVMSLQKA